ncbi:DEAD/DEAH box helicase [Nocardioides jensenii]|uniref:DEAD/DEAH box helicase n=1 Tax=Nocardioides jensenii TaxID=1843 RepID=UPI000832C609|nr:SNF2-related protein [Nocardioides jensenii]
MLGAITEPALSRAFDVGALSRGRSYAARGMVLGFEIGEMGEAIEIVGRVAGNRAAPYSVSVLLEPPVANPHIDAECSCPVSFGCKHAAALLLVVRESERAMPPLPATPAWQRDLDAVLGELEQARPEPARRLGLALRFNLPRPSRSRYAAHLPPAVTLRPLQQGARRNWIKTGIDWQQLHYAHLRSELDPEQVAVLSALATAFGPNGVRDGASLRSVGPQLWPLLRRAIEVDLPFVPHGRLSSIEVLDEPLDLTADLVETEQGSRLALGVWLGDQHLSGESVQFVGRQPHGVSLTVPTQPNSTAQVPMQRLLLAPLARRVPEALRRLQEKGGLIDVPAPESASFVRDYLPRLRNSLPVTSSDGSIPLPDEVPPRLRLTVDWRTATEVGLVWAFVYQRNEEELVFALDSADPARGVRRTGAEARLLDELALDDVSRNLLHGPDDALAPRQALDDLWVLMFAEAVLPALRESGQVEILEEGTRPDYREAVGEPEIEFALSEPAQGGDPEDDRTDWLDLEVVIQVDGEQVPLPFVLAALTAGQERLILPSGLHIALDRPEFGRLARLVAAAAELQDKESEGVRVGRHDLGLWAELAELGVVDAQAEQWVAAAKALTRLEGLPDVEPIGLKSELRSYQHDGFRWLVQLWQAGLGGILADDMGLGKTLQTLALIGHARASGADPFLVVAPTSVMTAWAHEAATHTPGLDVRIIDASAARRGCSLAEAVAGADLVVTSYTLFRLEAEAYAALPWGGLVLDEAQAIKNHQGKTYQAVRKLDVPFRLAVTGTPFENRLMELWALLSVVAPGLYPWPRRFGDLVVKPVEKHGDQAALDRFRTRIRPFILRRTKDLVAADLPAKQEQVLEVALGAKHQRVYDTHLQRERQAILGLVDDFDRNRVAIFSSLTKLRQLSLDAALVDPEHESLGSAKLDALVDHLVEVTAEGHRALVFSQFTGFLKRARARLEEQGITCRYLDGATRDRRAEIDGFKNGDADAFLISLKAGGVGLTLTEADYVFVLDPWWNPASEAQAVDRAHRIGQQRPVMVYRLVATGTIEEKVMELKERKAALFASVFEGDAAMGQGIDADDVRSLFDD